MAGRIGLTCWPDMLVNQRLESAQFWNESLKEWEAEPGKHMF